MTNNNRETNGEELSDSESFTGADATPTTATGWVVPSLEADLEKRADSLKTAIDSAQGDYMDFLEDHQNELVVFFAIASEILDDQGRDLFVQELLAEEYEGQDESNDYALVDQLGGPKKFEMLKHYRAIEDDLADDIEETQNYRARLVHDPQKRHRITDLDTLRNRIETATGAVEGLQSQLASDSAD